MNKLEFLEHVGKLATPFFPASALTDLQEVLPNADYVPGEFVARLRQEGSEAILDLAILNRFTLSTINLTFRGFVQRTIPYNAITFVDFRQDGNATTLEVVASFSGAAARIQGPPSTDSVLRIFAANLVQRLEEGH
jgi:hypothetical protein